MRHIRKAALTAALALLFGCSGGGTDGTGGRNIDGLILSPAGGAQPGIEVTVEETGDSTVTDAQGAFTISGQPMTASMTLHFSGSGLDYAAPLADIPARATAVHMNCVYDTAKHEFTVESTSFDY
jgi:hypothetical protein